MRSRSNTWITHGGDAVAPFGEVIPYGRQQAGSCDEVAGTAPWSNPGARIGGLSCPMRIVPGLLAAVLASGVGNGAAAAPREPVADVDGIRITAIEIVGLPPEMEANVRRRLSLASQLDR